MNSELEWKSHTEAKWPKHANTKLRCFENPSPTHTHAHENQVPMEGRKGETMLVLVSNYLGTNFWFLWKNFLFFFFFFFFFFIRGFLHGKRKISWRWLQWLKQTENTKYSTCSEILPPDDHHTRVGLVADQELIQNIFWSAFHSKSNLPLTHENSIDVCSKCLSAFSQHAWSIFNHFLAFFSYKFVWPWWPP